MLLPAGAHQSRDPLPQVRDRLKVLVRGGVVGRSVGAAIIGVPSGCRRESGGGFVGIVAQSPRRGGRRGTSVRYRHHGWLGLPVRFTRGAAQPFLPPLNPDEQRRLTAAVGKLHYAYQTLAGAVLADTDQPPTSTREAR
jgi:hypothetical protein